MKEESRTHAKIALATEKAAAEFFSLVRSQA